jgi:hypothetical protein
MLKLLLGSGKLVTALARAGLALRRDRSRAMRGFRRALIEMGLPEHAARELAAAYPRLDLGVLSRRERGKGQGVPL